MIARTPSDSDLLVQFERDNIEDDYHVLHAIKHGFMLKKIEYRKLILPCHGNP